MRDNPNRTRDTGIACAGACHIQHRDFAEFQVDRMCGGSSVNGFLFMDSPGFDPASVTGQIAGGCNIVSFTTGRGSAFGSKPSPTIKLSSTSRLYERMPEDIDID